MRPGHLEIPIRGQYLSWKNEINNQIISVTPSSFFSFSNKKGQLFSRSFNCFQSVQKGEIIQGWEEKIEKVISMDHWKGSDFSLNHTAYSFHLYWTVFTICMKLNAPFIKRHNLTPWRSTNMPHQASENSRLLAESSPKTLMYRLNAAISISR